MRLVINRCYGGYSLSAKAVKRLAELQGKPCFFFKHDYAKKKRFIPVTIEEVGHSMFFDAFTTDDPNSLTKDNFDDAYITSRPEPRSDPLLIQVVEELGRDADGDCAELKIVEIPDGTDYEIDEYDGIERIAEAHRVWI